jgi:hypothetical protein
MSLRSQDGSKPGCRPIHAARISGSRAGISPVHHRCVRYIGANLRGTEARYVGHNPAGGATILALMAAMLGTAFTGWLLYTDASYDDDGMVALHSFLCPWPFGAGGAASGRGSARLGSPPRKPAVGAADRGQARARSRRYRLTRAAAPIAPLRAFVH